MMTMIKFTKFEDTQLWLKHLPSPTCYNIEVDRCRSNCTGV